MNSITFSVTYQLPEYLATGEENSLNHIAKQAREKGRKPPTKLPVYARWLLRLVATLAFRYKISKVGTCEFTINAQSIRRKSKMGELVIPWADVIAIEPLTLALLLEKGQGAVMLPWRCMTPEQRATLQNWIALRQQQLGDAQ
jgi:hypothetical protein